MYSHTAVGPTSSLCHATAHHPRCPRCRHVVSLIRLRIAKHMADADGARRGLAAAPRRSAAFRIARVNQAQSLRALRHRQLICRAAADVSTLKSSFGGHATWESCTPQQLICTWNLTSEWRRVLPDSMLKQLCRRRRAGACGDRGGREGAHESGAEAHQRRLRRGVTAQDASLPSGCQTSCMSECIKNRCCFKLSAQARACSSMLRSNVCTSRAFHGSSQISRHVRCICLAAA